MEGQIQGFYNSKNETHAYVYHVQCSTIRFSIDDPFGPPIDHAGKIRGDTLTDEISKGCARQEEKIYRLVKSESTSTGRSRR